MKIKFSERPRCKNTAYSQFMDWCKEDLKSKYPHAHFDSNNLARKCTLKWQIMPRVDKKRFQIMAESDIKKQQPMKKSHLYVETIPKRKSTKSKNRPILPICYRSAFAWFKTENRQKVLQAYPSYSMSEISRELSKRWKRASGKVQNNYKQIAINDKQRYDAEMTELKANGPINVIGTNDQHTCQKLSSKQDDKLNISQMIISSTVESKASDIGTAIEEVISKTQDTDMEEYSNSDSESCSSRTSSNSSRSLVASKCNRSYYSDADSAEYSEDSDTPYLSSLTSDEEDTDRKDNAD